MDKRQLIEAIRQFNPSATVAFLSQFDAPDLQQYLNRLEDTQGRGAQIATWVRPRRQDYSEAS